MKDQAAVGTFRHLVTVQGPGANIPDGDGGYTHTWAALDPETWRVSIEPATAKDLERVAAGTVLTTNMYIIKGRHHPQVTTSSRLVFGTRVFQLTGVSNPEERNIQTVAVAVELMDAPPVTDTSWAQQGWMQ